MHFSLWPNFVENVGYRATFSLLLQISTRSVQKIGFCLSPDTFLKTRFSARLEQDLTLFYLW